MLVIILAVFVGCILLERLIPGWKLPAVPTWTIRVLAINFVQLLVVIVAELNWEKWLSAYSPLHLSRHVSAWAGVFRGHIRVLLVA